MSISDRQWQQLELPSWADHPSAQWDPATLAGWDPTKRIKLTIDSSLIDADLEDFPVMIKLGTSVGIGSTDVSEVFDELTADANRFKIAVTTSDGVTECYVEIERWDDANEVAILHVKVPFVESTQDTELYLYFDADHADNTDYVGDTGDTAAQSVWDSNFVGVWHLNQDPSGGADCILDSTSNNLDGTPGGTMLTGDLVEGQQGAYAIDFDGTDDEIQVADNATLDAVLSPNTFEVTIKTTVDWDPAVNDYTGFLKKGHHKTDIGLRIYERSTGSVTRLECGESQSIVANSFANGTWKYVAGVVPASGNDRIYVDGIEVAAYVVQGDTTYVTNDHPLMIGNIYHDTADYKNFDGQIGEARISDTERSDAWLKATQYSLSDALITHSSTWLYGWGKKRLQIVVDSDLIDGDLTNFPLAIKLNSDSGPLSFDAWRVFNELSYANRKRIAVTTADHQTQCYVEIEQWDSTNLIANLHVKVASILAASDTYLYLYFDVEQSDNDTYVGDTGDAVAQNVWDADFLYVFHMAQDPTGGAGAMLDSTGNTSGTSGGTMTAGDLVDAGGASGKGLDMDGSDDQVYTADAVGSMAGEFTMEMYLKFDNITSRRSMLNSRSDNNNLWFFGLYDPGTLYLYERLAGATKISVSSNASAVGTSAYHHISVRRASDDTITFEVDGAADGTASDADTLTEHSTYLDIAGEAQTSNLYDNHDGIISEVRISNDSERSAAWLKATYNTLADLLLGIVDDSFIIFAADVNVAAGTPANITYAVNAALVSVSVPATTAAYVMAVLAASAGVGIDTGTPAIIWAALAATTDQNFNAIGIISKPTVSAGKPSATATATQPGASVSAGKPSITATGKQPTASAEGARPTITVTSKGD